MSSPDEALAVAVDRLRGTLREAAELVGNRAVPHVQYNVLRHCVAADTKTVIDALHAKERATYGPPPYY